MAAETKGFGALFGSAKDKLDHLQASMASVLPSFPGQPAAKYFDLAMGVDFHATVFPPSPLLPVPHIGMVFDIMGVIMAAISAALPPAPEPPAPAADGEEPPPQPVTLAGVAQAVVSAMKPSVQVHGQWIANAGTSIQHLPGIIAHVLPVVAPMASSEMWMGSSTVLADGSPFSTMFHPALSCNLVGFPSLFRKSKPPKPKVALMAPTSMLLTITSGGAPVLVGGPPTIDLFQLMFKLALKGLGKLWKKAGNKFQKLIDKIKTKNPKLARILQPIKCRLFGEPVDAATGRVYHTNTDFALPGPIPLEWSRTYYSDAEVDGPLGYNWHHSYNLGLYDMGNGYFTLRLADGRETVVPALAEGDTFYSRTEKLTWAMEAGDYLYTDADDLSYRFSNIRNRDGYRVLASIHDKEGHRITFSYTGSGALKGITDSAGRQISVETDVLDRVLALRTTNKGETITLIAYGYDGAGNMVQTVDALGAIKHFVYEGHLLVKLTNQSGMSFYWEYEGRGDDARCIHTWGDGGILEYTTSYEPGLTTTRNSLGHTTQYFYGEDKLIYKIIDAHGGITHQHYNEHQELILVVNPEGLATRTTYNEWGDVVRYENENNAVTSYSYDEQRNLTEVTSPGGRSVEWTYDAEGRMTERRATGSSPLYYSYEAGRLRTITTEGRSFILHYNRQGALNQLTYPNGTYQQWQYDELGNVTSQRDVKGNITQYHYDAGGNMVWLREPDGNEHRFTYDAAGNMVEAKDQLHQVQFTYGPLGTLTGRRQNGAAVRFGYNNELQLKSIANEGGEVYRFGLDGLGQVVSEWGFDGMQRRYERDGAGRVTRVLRPDKRWTTYQYDGTGQVVKEDHYDGTGAAYRYDKDGLLLEAFNEDGHIKLKRDRAGRILEEVQGGYAVSKQYDKQGSLRATTSSLGAAIEHTHDADGYLQSMKAGTWQSTWQRDEAGLEIQRSLSGGVSVKTERDSLGRVTKRSIGANNTEQSRTRYQWGRGNRLQSIVNELTHASASFDYDAFDNLVSGTYQQGAQTETIYRAPDKIGNLFKTKERKDRKYSTGGRLEEDPKYYYYYDAEGNLVYKEFKFSSYPRLFEKKELEKKYGKLKGSGTGWQYGWAGNGMLESVILPQGSKVVFSYDPLGRRIAKQYKGRVTRWVWDGNVPLHEWQYRGKFPPQTLVDAKGNLEQSEEPVANLITWLYEEGSFVPCAKLTEEEQYSIIADYLGTPTHAFNAKGEQVWERELDIYGAVRKETGQKGLIPQLYQGQWVDNETGLAYNRFRYYDNDSGNYISQDPIGLHGGFTFYGYVLNANSWIDPLGLIVTPIYTRGSRGQIITASATITRADIGTGTATNASSRAQARSLGLSNDDAGHIIGKNLGGSGGVGHVFPQKANINRGQFNQFEQNVANMVRTHGSVDVNVALSYHPGSTRPHNIMYTVTAPNGQSISRSFHNH